MNIKQGSITTDKDGYTHISVEIVIAPSYKPGDAMAMEANLWQQFNSLSCTAMSHLLQRFDTCGEPLRHGGIEYTSKGRSPGTYQCAGGEINLERHLYQSAQGGKTYCPLEEHARIIANATPHFARIISSQYSAQSGRATQRTLQETRQRHISLDYIQEVSGLCGKTALAQEKGRPYALRADDTKVEAIVAMADSTCTHIVDEGWKHVSAGAFVLLDAEGQRLETIYLANAPEDNKVTFWKRMELEYQRLCQHYPEVPWIGLCDGAKDIQHWLEQRCDILTLDFYHLSEYLASVKEAFGRSPQEHQQWLESILHRLKHEEGAAGKILGQLQAKAKAGPSSSELHTKLEKTITYLKRNLERMHYALLIETHLPIGSGWIEAACKHVVKHRSNVSGARWTHKGLQRVLSLRSLYLSSDRWSQFWERCAQFGY